MYSLASTILGTSLKLFNLLDYKPNDNDITCIMISDKFNQNTGLSVLKFIFSCLMLLKAKVLFLQRVEFLDDDLLLCFLVFKKRGGMGPPI